MRTRPNVFAVLLTSVLWVTSAWSQEAPVAPPVAPAPAAPSSDVRADSAVAPTKEPEVIIQGAEPTENTATKSTNDFGADTLSVDFPDEDIRNILRNVADLFELNLVVPDTLQGRTSIKLRDVSWRQIYQVVLTPVGFTYIEEGNIIKVVSNESLLQEPVATEVFILNYAEAGTILPTLSSLIDPAIGGKIVVDARSNALVITERPSQMNKIRPIIETLDKATSQVMIESKFVEVTDSDVKNIGVNWSSLAGMQLGASNLSQTWSRGRNQNSNDGANGSSGNTQSNNTTGSTTTSTTNDGGNTITYVTGFDTPGTQVASTVNMPNGTVSGLPSTVSGRTQAADYVPAVAPIPATATSAAVPGTPASATAINTYNGLISGNSGTTGGTSSQGSATNAVSSLYGLTHSGSQSRLASAVFSASDFNVIISALKTQNDTKLVSNPTVVTLNNTEAVINIGKEYPIPNYTYNQERGTYEVSGFEYRPIGIILKVTPQVNARGFIKLTIEPEVSSSTESAPFGATAIPIITTRKTKTQVSLRDGFTMGIGGLIENSEMGGQTKVPVLGSIPLLGRLFRSETKNDTSRNLIIFITAKTVNAEGASVEEVFDSRRVRELNMRRSDLPGYRDGSDPFLADEAGE